MRIRRKILHPVKPCIPTNTKSSDSSSGSDFLQTQQLVSCDDSTNSESISALSSDKSSAIISTNFLFPFNPDVLWRSDSRNDARFCNNILISFFNWWELQNFVLFCRLRNVSVSLFQEISCQK